MKKLKGEKVFSAAVLKKQIKQEKRKKEKSKSQWANRKAEEAEKFKEKQRQRQQNIQEHLDKRKAKKIQKRVSFVVFVVFLTFLCRERIDLDLKERRHRKCNTKVLRKNLFIESLYNKKIYLTKIKCFLYIYKNEQQYKQVTITMRSATIYNLTR